MQKSAKSNYFQSLFRFLSERSTGERRHAPSTRRQLKVERLEDRQMLSGGSVHQAVTTSAHVANSLRSVPAIVANAFQTVTAAKKQADTAAVKGVLYALVVVDGALQVSPLSAGDYAAFNPSTRLPSGTSASILDIQEVKDLTDWLKQRVYKSSLVQSDPVLRKLMDRVGWSGNRMPANGSVFVINQLPGNQCTVECFSSKNFL